MWSIRTVAVAGLVAATALVACTSTVVRPPADSRTPADSGVSGELSYLETIGARPAPLPRGKPHAGEVRIERPGDAAGDWVGVVTIDVGPQGDFRIALAPGRYRYVAWIPRLHELADPSMPLLRDVQPFVVRPHRFTSLRPTVYLELT